MKIPAMISVMLLYTGTALHGADSAPFLSLSELAEKADLVAVVQVSDTDYVYTRSFPSEGSAFLNILIAYKPGKYAGKMIEVHEHGLHPHECYFENPEQLAGGRRYLVFLRLNPDDPGTYRGLAQGCSLEILVTAQSRYALKYPINSIALTDKLDKLINKYDYHDSHALETEDSLSPDVRKDLLARGLLEHYQGKFKYTYGIDLTRVRKLIHTGSLEN